VYSPSLTRDQTEVHVTTFAVHREERRQDAAERHHSSLYSRVEPVVYSYLVGLSHLTVID
jgi:hypothetical protein